FLQHIFKLHGFPVSIISDRGSLFVSLFWKRLLELVDVQPRPSTAYHPQTDGQTERVNQELEQYLRSYCSYQQDDWCDYLSLAEFSYNNHTSSSSQVSPFFANYGFHPAYAPKVADQPKVPAAEDLATSLSNIHSELKAELQHAQEDHARFYNRHAQPAPEFLPGQLVWLNRRNLKTTRPSDKLDYRKLGPFKIVRPVGSLFHVSLLEPYTSPDNIEGRFPPAPEPVYIDPGGSEWYEIDDILDVRKIGQRFEYFVNFKDKPIDERTWVPLTDISTEANELIERFHRRHPRRPRPARL
ncbi:ribonuclease H-like protein, partial [Calocera cornea HHB12733]